MSRKQVTFHVSEEEREVIRQMAGKNQSAWLRKLCRQEAARRGVKWPGDTLEDTRGKYPRKLYQDRHQFTARITPTGVGVREFADDPVSNSEVSKTLRREDPAVEMYLVGDGWTPGHIHDAQMEALVLVSEREG